MFVHNLDLDLGYETPYLGLFSKKFLSLVFFGFFGFFLQGLEMQF